MSVNERLCRCGSNIAFSTCCEPFLTRKVLPNTAEQLMRSRFTAFCLNQATYLYETHHPSKRESNAGKPLQNPASPSTWISLQIITTDAGHADQKLGKVEFIACFEEQNKHYQLHEKSSFVKEQGRWFYLDGEPHISSVNLKFKRNALCWCQSGQKHKHCHGA
ncbi:MAG: SEC-C domain-containing protein [Cycloclasticus sp.]|nr:SEC-C domain-containing protein [Cycloclasticus sp.]MBQ0789488.1 SEC-C domain-containing protein [Cycloclasticus sp.]